MEEKIIRFKTSPRIAHKRHLIFPESKYYNKLHNSLRIFTKFKNLSKIDLSMKMKECKK